MSHLNTPSVRNRSPLTARSNSLRCVTAAEHQTAEQHSKTGRTKPRKHLIRSYLSWNTSHDQIFEKLFWKLSKDTVPQIVNGGDWGCIVSDLETIVVLVSLEFNFIPQRSHHSLTLQRSQIRDSAVDGTEAWEWHNSHQSEVISITYQLIFQNGKKLRSVQDEQ